MIGRLSSIVLDCPDPRALAGFYSELLGLPVSRVDGDWVDVGDRSGWHLSFQQAPDHQPPRWPDPAHPQQFHLDILVDDIDEAEPKVLALGAKRLPALEEGVTFRVYADPAGHPFCLCWD
jgi:catechol 2,3-dioxygenase-like lactoylglutathione lyase family enzyme